MPGAAKRKRQEGRAHWVELSTMVSRCMHPRCSLWARRKVLVGCSGDVNVDSREVCYEQSGMWHFGVCLKGSLGPLLREYELTSDWYLEWQVRAVSVWSGKRRGQGRARLGRLQMAVHTRWVRWTRKG